MILLITLALVLTVSGSLAIETRARYSVRGPRSSWELAATTSGRHRLI